MGSKGGHISIRDKYTDSVGQNACLLICMFIGIIKVSFEHNPQLKKSGITFLIGLGVSHLLLMVMV